MEQLRSNHILILCMVLLALKSPAVSGQRSPFDPEVFLEAFQISEHVEVFTDRSMYTVNEHIHFRAEHVVEGLQEGRSWSTILYVELVASNGTSLVQAKFDLSEQVCSGSLVIPPNTLSGNYFLKCYTRWMRNRGPENFSYTPLKIINPFRSEVSNRTNGGNGVQSICRREYTTGLLECVIPDLPYQRGEDVRVQLSGPVHTHLQRVNCCITVVPFDAIDTLKGQLTFPGTRMDSDEFRVQFLPDLYGASLSGTVIRTDQDNGPGKFTKLHFSLLGDQPEYFATISDADGRFVVTTPARTGTQEMFVSPESGDEGGIEVRIDQDFEPGSLPVSAEPFTLSSGEHEVATQMAVKMQLSESFAGSEYKEVVQVDTDHTPFYGTPMQSIKLDDYVNLPTMEEVFINLVPHVFVIKRRNRTTLKIHSDNSAIGIYSPLIMIDHIPVFDQDAMISINPEKVQRIDVVNEVYVKGSVTYGGVISIITRSGDMAGIDLPSGSYFFDYQAIHPELSEREQEPAPGDRVPDTRNTLLWIADLELERGIPREITFKAPSSPGDYLVFIRGMAGPGEVLSAAAPFRVN